MAMTITTAIMLTHRNILLPDFLATGTLGGVGPGAGGGAGASGIGVGGGVCVGGVGVVCGSIRLSLSLIYGLIVTHIKHNSYLGGHVQLLQWIT
jgi:hypothetical protein